VKILSFNYTQKKERKRKKGEEKKGIERKERETQHRYRYAPEKFCNFIQGRRRGRGKEEKKEMSSLRSIFGTPGYTYTIEFPTNFPRKKGGGGEKKKERKKC